jgi:hypothetical protein
MKQKKNHCKDCGKEIYDVSTRCQSCANKLSLNGFKKGESKGHKWKKGEHSSPETEFKNGHKINIGKLCKEETKKKISEGNTGDKTSRWKGGYGAYLERRRGLGFIPLNKKFIGSEAHHLNKELVVYIPKLKHRKHYGKHCVHKPETMVEVNTEALTWFMENCPEPLTGIIISGLKGESKKC